MLNPSMQKPKPEPATSPKPADPTPAAPGVSVVTPGGMDWGSALEALLEELRSVNAPKAPPPMQPPMMGGSSMMGPFPGTKEGVEARNQAMFGNTLGMGMGQLPPMTGTRLPSMGGGASMRPPPAGAPTAPPVRQNATQPDAGQPAQATGGGKKGAPPEKAKAMPTQKGGVATFLEKIADAVAARLMQEPLVPKSKEDAQLETLDPAKSYSGGMREKKRGGGQVRG